MRFLKTLLGALALCTALLVWAGHVIGPGQPESRTTPGLTAAEVLASDGMAPDGRPGEPHPDRAVQGRLVDAISSGKSPAASGAPAG
jgi:hypothetical protein